MNPTDDTKQEDQMPGNGVVSETPGAPGGVPTPLNEVPAESPAPEGEVPPTAPSGDTGQAT